MAYQRRYKVPVDMAIEQADMFSNKAGEIVADVKSRGQEALDGMKKAVARKTPAGSTSD